MKKLEYAMLVVIVICIAILLISLSQGQTGDPCDRLDPCCYGQGEPDYIYHASQSYRYWEYMDRETNATVFQIWHYWNGTWLFFDNTTKHSTIAQSHLTLHNYVTVQEKDSFSKDGRCWLDRMVEYIE